MTSSIQMLCLLCSVKLPVPFSKDCDEVKKEKFIYKRGNKICVVRELTAGSEAYNISRCMNV